MPEAKSYPIHPACAKWPRPPAAEFEALVADIKANGLLNPVWLTAAGEILEGKVRYEACLRAGVAPRFEIYRGDDPIGFTISHNKLRRHMSAAQLAFIGEELSKLKAHRPNNSRGHESKPQKEIARELGVTPQMITAARVLKAHGETRIIDLVKTGQVYIESAAAYARNTPRETQRAASTASIRTQGSQLRYPTKVTVAGPRMSPRMRTIARAKQNYTGPNFSSSQSQELKEKLRPLIERLRFQSKQNIAAFCPYELECIAFDLEKLLAQWANTEPPASVKQATGS